MRRATRRLQPATGMPIAVFAGIVPCAFGLLLGWTAERTVFSALLLLAEPLLLGLGLYLVAALLLHRKWTYGLALGMGVVFGMWAVRLPAVPRAPAALEEGWADTLRACAASTDLVGVPLRVLSWTAKPGSDTSQWVESIAEPRPDVVVLHGVATSELGELLASRMNGTAKHYLGTEEVGGLSIVVRGDFSTCAGEPDSWEMELPTAEGRSAQLVLTFPDVAGVGPLPLMVVRVDRLGSPDQWGGWPARVDVAGRRIAAVAQAIGPSHMVVAGDFEAPRTFRLLAGQMLGAGLMEARVPPSWPTALGPLPFLPLHHFERIWTGDGWVVESSRTLRMANQSRAMVLVDLSPVEAEARNGGVEPR